MLENKQLLIIDDDKQRSHDLGVVFEFIGEICQEAASDNWQQHFQNSEHLIGVLVGTELVGRLNRMKC